MIKHWSDNPVYRAIFMIFIFGTIVFPLGFYTLLAGPSKWVLEAAMKYSWSDHKEKLVQQGVILVLFLVSFKLTVYFKKFFLSNSPAFLRYFSLSLLILLFLSSVYVFSFKPEVFIKLSGSNSEDFNQSSVSSSGQNIEFVTGAYPDLNELKRLKRAGYAGVVSLLHELVIPAEPNLIREEDQNAKEAGISLTRIPMLPWVSGNNESILKIQKLAREGKGKYYVHCYLGRDRVNVFRKIIRDMGAKSVSLQADVVRHIDDLPRFERGKFTKLSTGAYLIPFPTDDEFFGYILNGQINSVVSLLDARNPADTLWISKEKTVLSRYGVKYINLPVPSVNDLAALKVFTDSFPKIKKPLVVHKFSSDDPIYEFIRKKYESVKK